MSMSVDLRKGVGDDDWWQGVVCVVDGFGRLDGTKKDCPPAAPTETASETKHRSAIVSPCCAASPPPSRVALG